MSDLPLPLTPAEAELRNFREMPLDVPRLLNSDLAHDESPEACWSALLLWCVSWHEVPAGSLPDNDDWLAKRAGYWHKGKLDPTWHDVRAGALHGWIKCSDGRLYHPVVAEKVNHAWHQKHRHAHEKLCERIRKRNKARAEKGLFALEIPDLEHWIDAGRPLERDLFPEEFRSTSAGKKGSSGGNCDSSGGIPADEFGNIADESCSSAGIPPENALKGAERSREEVNLLTSGGGTAQAVTREDAPNAAAAFVEILRSNGVAFVVDDERVAGWPALGATPDDLRTAIGAALARRKREKSDQPLNVGLLNSMLPDAIAARAGRAGAGARAAPAGPWHTSWPGIVAHGRSLGLEQGEHEACPDFKLRVFRAAGDGPWWDDHNRAFRNSAGPVAAGAMLGGTGR
ncbi:YdaU family protein [Burkholderia glumae]|uniref:YdaU family protein n=1 Tax=Burkholderia glumae TaxID=337 RepID=UPI0020CBEEB3|nr:YdaU family protein [Burkholderia glumae]MCQ0032561.1 YdaU family protein [Burkholderia glumae]MCQ0035801.1 YdaU family protein [Burkholderia glumae]